MAVEMFSWPSLHERMCRTWGSNSGPLACQANSLPIELSRPGINWFASIQLFHAFVGNSQNNSSLFGRLMHCCPRPSGWEQQYIRSSTAQRERWFWLMPMKAWNSCFISQLVFFYSFLKHKKKTFWNMETLYIYLFIKFKDAANDRFTAQCFLDVLILCSTSVSRTGNSYRSTVLRDVTSVKPIIM